MNVYFILTIILLSLAILSLIGVLVLKKSVQRTEESIKQLDVLMDMLENGCSIEEMLKQPMPKKVRKMLEKYL